MSRHLVAAVAMAGLNVACGPMMMMSPDGGMGGGSSGGGTGGGASGAELVVSEDTEVSDVVVVGDVAYFCGTRNGTGLIATARVMNGSVTVTTLCEHSGGGVSSLVVQGTEVHALVPNVLGPGKVLRTTTSASGGACPVLGDATPLFLFGKVHRIGGALYYLGPTSGTTNPQVKRFDLSTNSEAQVTSGAVKSPAMGTDGTSLFVAEPQPAGSGLQVVRTSTAGADPTVMFTTPSATIAFAFAGGNLGWVDGDRLVFMPAQGTPAAPQTALASVGSEQAVVLCGTGPSNTIVFSVDRGPGTGTWLTPLAPNAQKTRLAAPFSNGSCAAGPATFWWIENDSRLRVKTR